MPLMIVRQDITKMDVDALVNAANTTLDRDGGVCGVGEAVMTLGLDLPARFVIHTVGPVYRDGLGGEEKKLRSCYLESLKLAVENGCESIAFPLISSGVYGYPKKEALRVALGAIREFLPNHDLDVYLAVLDKDAFTTSEDLLGEVASYLEANYVAEEMMFSSHSIGGILAEAPLEDLVGNLDEPFAATLMRLIDAKGKDDVEVYKKANIDRRLFSKIRSNKGYIPSKRTILALAVGLELSLDETNDLLRRAGFALSRSQVCDVIVEYFLINEKYDVMEINEVLFNYDQPLLGGA